MNSNKSKISVVTTSFSSFILDNVLPIIAILWLVAALIIMIIFAFAEVHKVSASTSYPAKISVYSGGKLILTYSGQCEPEVYGDNYGYIVDITDEDGKTHKIIGGTIVIDSD